MEIKEEEIDNVIDKLNNFLDYGYNNYNDIYWFWAKLQNIYCTDEIVEKVIYWAFKQGCKAQPVYDDDRAKWINKLLSHCNDNFNNIYKIGDEDGRNYYINRFIFLLNEKYMSKVYKQFKNHILIESTKELATLEYILDNKLNNNIQKSNINNINNDTEFLKLIGR